MHVLTQNLVLRSDKKASRLAQWSFQSLLNDQFLNILQLWVVPSWAEDSPEAVEYRSLPFSPALSLRVKKSEPHFFFLSNWYQWILSYTSQSPILFCLLFPFFFSALLSAILPSSPLLSLSSINFFIPPVGKFFCETHNVLSTVPRP